METKKQVPILKVLTYISLLIGVACLIYYVVQTSQIREEAQRQQEVQTEVVTPTTSGPQDGKVSSTQGDTSAPSMDTASSPQGKVDSTLNAALREKWHHTNKVLYVGAAALFVFVITVNLRWKQKREAQKKKRYRAIHWNNGNVQKD